MKLRLIFENITDWWNKNLKIASTKALDGKNKGEKKEKTTYLIPLTLGFGLAVFITLMFPGGRSFQFSDLKEGDVYIGEEIIAPFSFPINKSPERYAKDIEEARLRVVPVFVRKDSISENQIRRLESFAKALQNIQESVPSDQNRMNSLSELLNLYNIIISDENLANLLKKNGTGKRLSKTIPAN
ncbi:MAG: hypothetical protein ONB05_10415, partial [candidate division KSB1 bacterium]|nr:hypothetical protein [candidate division KSB1 bacterium]